MKEKRFVATNSTLAYGSPQQAIIKDGIITVHNKIFWGKRTLGSFKIPLSTWLDTYKNHPTFNVAYNQRDLIKRMHMAAFSANMIGQGLSPFADRIVDAELDAIRKAFKKYQDYKKEQA